MKRRSWTTAAPGTIGAGILATVFAFTHGPADAAEPGRIKVSTGFDYSTGDYGDTIDTQIWYYPVVIKYESFPFSLKATIPYVEITGPGGVVAGDTPTVVAGGGTARETNSGLGDVILAATYSIDPRAEWAPLVDFTGKVKVPTGDEDEGLSTGNTDYHFIVDLAKPMGDWIPLGTVGYKMRGGSLDNSLLASVGVHRKLSNTLSGGLILDWIEPSSDFSDDSVETMLYAGWKISGPWTLTSYGVKGFTDGSPDYEVGMQISYRHDLDRGIRF